MYDDFVAGARDRSGRAIEYARTGSLHVAMTDADVTRLTALAAWLNGKDLACRWLEGDALRQAEPAVTPKALGALRIETHGFVSVQDLVSALMQAAKFSGAVCETPLEAVRVEPGAHSARVIIGNNARIVEADVVVLAAGAWSGRVHVNGAPDLPVKPIRGQLLHLQWPDVVPMPTQIAWGAGCYTVPWSNRTLLVGATAEDVGFDERSTVAGVSTLMASVMNLLPDASRAALAEVRVGLRPAAPTHMPIIGPVAGQPRVIAATRHLRNGIMLAPMTASLVRQAINGMGQ
jgi:glycine oxidase